MTLERKSELKQHFTDAKQINEMMCYLLGNMEGRSLLEPSVGHGAFLRGLIGKPSKVHAVDVDCRALSLVESNFRDLGVHVFQDDFVHLFVNGLMSASHEVHRTLYDSVISNPPYGLYFDLDYRKKIKRAFPDCYARESYGLFFTFAVSRLRDDGRYVFLIPDTFLSSVNHRPLRLFMCAQAAPTHIIRFPSRLFETVNFGYGNLCIVAGHKRVLRTDDTLQWLDVFGKEEHLSLKTLKHTKVLSGSIILKNAKLGWCPAMFDGTGEAHNWRTLAEIADCRTGIYTGNNERFIGYDAARITRRVNGHSIDWPNKLFQRPLNETQRQSGLDNERHYVPLIRGGHREPFEKTAWAIDWSKRAVEFYKTDGKARFQNSTFYFRAGLSVPMVTTKRISAAMMREAVFDQGVVGVFPYKPADIPTLLLYLNSRYASEKMKTIVNGSANNSANYLKRLAIPFFSDFDTQHAAEIVGDAMRCASLPQSMCDDFVEEVLNSATRLDTR